MKHNNSPIHKSYIFIITSCISWSAFYHFMCAFSGWQGKAWRLVWQLSPLVLPDFVLFLVLHDMDYVVHDVDHYMYCTDHNSLSILVHYYISKTFFWGWRMSLIDTCAPVWRTTNYILGTFHKLALVIIPYFEPLVKKQ